MRATVSSLLLASLAAPAATGQTTTVGPATQNDWRPAAAYFTDVSKPTGTAFEHEDGAFSYAMGSGVAWVDVDTDGDEDLILLSSLDGSVTLANEGGKFTDVTTTIGPITEPGDEPIGIICADYDQDGLTDIYYCNVAQNRLYRNQGGSFFDVSSALGVTGGHSWSTSASWADFDVDGDLDLYVGNYIRILNFPYHYGAANFLFENRGPGAGPQFLNVAQSLGVDDTDVFGGAVKGFPYIPPTGEPTAGCTLSTGTLDYDEDGDPDLYVGNDFGQWVTSNKLYRNDQVGAGMAFTNVTTATGFDTRPHYNMGIVPCDYDHDGDWDFYHSNLGDNLLLRNDGGTFVDATYTAGPVSGQLEGGFLVSSWGMIFQDFDNDGWEDIVVANGYIPAADFIENEVRIENDLWINEGVGTFRKIPNKVAGHYDRGPARGIAAADYNVDGLLDYYVQNNGANYVAFPGDQSRLYRNTGHFATGGWIELGVAGRLTNREGFGTRIDLTAGGMTWKRQVLCDPVFLSNPSRVVHVGLGDAARIDRIDVYWPTGIEQSWFDVDINAKVQLLEPAVTVVDVDPLQYSTGTLSAHATVENHETIAQPTTITVTLEPVGGGTPLVFAPRDLVVPPSTTLDVRLDASVNPGAYAALQGGMVEVRIAVEATGALDEDRAPQPLP